MMDSIAEKRAQAKQGEIPESLIGMMRRECPDVRDLDKIAAQVLEDHRAGTVTDPRGAFMGRCRKRQRDQTLHRNEQASGNGDSKDG
jgi:hypothetical protein